DRRSRGAAEPLEWLLVAGRPVDLDVPATPVADDRLDGALVADHPLILGVPHGLEQRLVHEAEMIAVAVVLRQHLPIGRAMMPDPASGQLDRAVGRQIARAVDELPGGA